MERFTSSPMIMLLTSVILGSFGQVFLKLGLKGEKGVAASGFAAVEGALRSLANPKVLMGFAMYGVSSIIWLMILKRVDLSKAYPMISLSYVFVVILSSVILRERVAFSTVIGLFLICGGVALIGIGMSQVGGK